MVDLIRAEVLKMRRSRLTPMVILALVAVFVLYYFSLRATHQDVSNALHMAKGRLTGAASICNAEGKCLDDVFRENPRARDLLQSQIRSLAAGLPAADAASSGAGMPPLVMGAMGSIGGVLVALLLSGHAVGVEFAAGTLPIVFTRRPQRWKFFLAKLAVAYATFIAIAAVVTLIVTMFAFLMSGQFGDAAALGLPSLGKQMTAPIVTGGMFTVLGVSIAFATGSAAVALAGGVTILAMDFLLQGVVPVLKDWTLNFNLWSLGAPFHSRVTPSVNSLWAGPSLLGRPRPLFWASIYLLSGSALVAMWAVRKLERSEVA